VGGGGVCIPGVLRRFLEVKGAGGGLLWRFFGDVWGVRLSGAFLGCGGRRGGAGGPGHSGEYSQGVVSPGVWGGGGGGCCCGVAFAGSRGVGFFLFGCGWGGLLWGGGGGGVGGGSLFGGGVLVLGLVVWGRCRRCSLKVRAALFFDAAGTPRMEDVQCPSSVCIFSQFFRPP